MRRVGTSANGNCEARGKAAAVCSEALIRHTEEMSIKLWRNMREKGKKCTCLNFVR